MTGVEDLCPFIEQAFHACRNERYFCRVFDEEWIVGLIRVQQAARQQIADER